MFTQSDFKKLADIQAPACLTMYIPTHRSGEETRNGHDALVLKDALKEAKVQLADQAGMDDKSIDTLLEPIAKLVDDEGFWRHQSDALAIYATPDSVEHFSLPIPMTQSSVHVSSQFNLRIAARLLAPSSRWYAYSVTQDENKFYECTRNSVTEIRISDLVPEGMEEVLEVYEGGETLQHSGKRGSAGSTISGQGSNEDRQDERIEILVRRLGQGITTLIAGQPEPLVLVADDQYIAGLKSSIDYPHIMEESININPSVLDPVAIQRETWRLVQPIFDRQVEELQEKYASANGGGSLVNGLADVVVAANGGQVAALYVAEEAEGRVGELDISTNAVVFSNDESSVNLLEKAIRDTISHGGQVLFRLSEEVPDTTDGVTAVLRYDY